MVWFFSVCITIIIVVQSSLWSVAVGVCGLFVEVETVKFTKHRPDVFPLLLEKEVAFETVSSAGKWFMQSFAFAPVISISVCVSPFPPPLSASLPACHISLSLPPPSLFLSLFPPSFSVPLSLPSLSLCFSVPFLPLSLFLCPFPPSLSLSSSFPPISLSLPYHLSVSLSLPSLSLSLPFLPPSLFLCPSLPPCLTLPFCFPSPFLPPSLFYIYIYFICSTDKLDGRVDDTSLS